MGAFGYTEVPSLNHNIFNNDPVIYLPEVDKEQLKRQFIPLEIDLWKMTKESYLAFLKERRRLLAQGINFFLNTLHQSRSQIYISRDASQWREKVSGSLL